MQDGGRERKVQKHLSRARQWALVDRGEGGGEREEREGESTNKYTQVQTRHNKTQNNTREGKEDDTRESGKNPKVGEGRSPDISQGGGSGSVHTINRASPVQQADRRQ